MPSWKLVLATMGIGTLASICMVGVAYAMVKVPTVNQTSTDQGATVYWNDGSQMMKIGSSRTVVQLNQISKPMQQAVVSVEDRNFYHESAVSPTGITRALINDLKGGSTQGGSTITQQYVKNAYLNQEQTISRKFKEIFISVKVGKQQDKDQILQNYLNTIFFGRGANGVEAAAQAYFGKHASALTVPEAAILAAQAKQPGYYDPAIKSHLQDTVNRYDIVLQAMVRSGAISQTDYLKYKDHLPKVKPRSKGNALGGQKGFLYERVKNALSGMGYSDQQIENGGLKVYTTWDKTLQAKAQQTVENDLKARHMPKDTRVGLVTMDPTKGEILAAYGGADFVKRQVDDAYYSTAQVGSSFKPYVLATALKKGISLKTIMNGKSPQYFTTDGDSVAAGTPGATRFINDEANAPNPYVNLVQATADSSTPSTCHWATRRAGRTSTTSRSRPDCRSRGCRTDIPVKVVSSSASPISRRSTRRAATPPSPTTVTTSRRTASDGSSTRRPARPSNRRSSVTPPSARRSRMTCSTPCSRS